MNSARISIVGKVSKGFDQIRFDFKASKPVEQVDSREYSGARNTMCLLREAGRRVLHVGLGGRKEFRKDFVRQAAGTGTKQLLRLGAEKLSLDLSSLSDHVQAAVEGSILASYRFEAFKAKSARRPNQLSELEVLIPASAARTAKSAAEAGHIVGTATNYTRSIGDLPPNVFTPKKLASEAAALSKRLKVRCRIWDERALKREGFGGILAVGQGSANPPRFIVIECPSSSAKAPTVAVVGKAMTFDSGGISIKPADRMEEMKWDKMGGCAVLGIVQAVRQLKLPVRLIGVIPSAENMPSAAAYRPSDLVTAWDGQTIEVLNTDAEGRVILADALSYVRKTFKPDLIVDLATLTGACVVALGERRAGLFTDDASLRARWIEVGEDTGDRVWPLPMGEEFQEQIRSDVALVKNTGGRYGGACTAASFLKNWVGDSPWVHLDIAGPAMGTKELPFLEKGATGFGVRLVTEFLRRM